MDEVLEKIGEVGLVPVVKIERADDALPLGKALVEGDLPVAEITFRTAAAQQAIANLSRELPDLLVGAGTVLTVEQVKSAVKNFVCVNLREIYGWKSNLPSFFYSFADNSTNTVCSPEKTPGSCNFTHYQSLSN